MTLPEATAWMLLREHCVAVFRRSFGPEQLECQSQSTATQWCSLTITSSLYQHEDEPDHGARLRLGVDVINALCACDGFSPTQNPQFWRHAMAELSGYAYTQGDHVGPFDDTVSFAQYAISLNCDHSNDACYTQLRDFVTGGMDVHEAIRDARGRVQQTLCGFLVREVRPLTFLLYVEGWNRQMSRWDDADRVEDGHLALANDVVQIATELMDMQRQQQLSRSLSTGMDRPAMGVQQIQLSISLQLDGVFHKFADGMARFLDIFVDGCAAGAAAPLLRLEHLELG